MAWPEPSVVPKSGPLQRRPTGSKCGQKRVNLYQNALNWVPSGLKWHQHELKWVKTGSKCGPEGSHAAQRGQNGLKMASNTPKWPFSAQICLSPHRRGSIQHSKMGGAGTGTPQGSALRLDSRFLPKSVHRVPPYPMYVATSHLPPKFHLLALPA